jgi:hypothetical protein
MVRRHPFFQRSVAEQLTLLNIFSTHNFQAYFYPRRLPAA